MKPGDWLKYLAQLFLPMRKPFVTFARAFSSALSKLVSCYSLVIWLANYTPSMHVLVFTFDRCHVSHKHFGDNQLS